MVEVHLILKLFNIPLCNLCLSYRGEQGEEDGGQGDPGQGGREGAAPCAQGGEKAKLPYEMNYTTMCRPTFETHCRG